jgi:branched-subunit amino acid transport protein
MSAAWVAVLALAAGTALIKGAGAALSHRRDVPARVNSVIALLPAALLAGLIATDTFTRGNHGLGLDARSAGLAAAAVAVALRAPMVVVIVIAAVVTALMRALG